MEIREVLFNTLAVWYLHERTLGEVRLFILGGKLMPERAIEISVKQIIAVATIVVLGGGGSCSGHRGQAVWAQAGAPCLTPSRLLPLRAER
jgi:hypothetical protein